MKRYLAGATNASNFSNRLNCANLVIRIHYRDQDSLISNRSRHSIWINQPIRINRKIRRMETKAVQILTGMKNGVMLYRRSNDMIALLLRGKGHPFNRQIIALRTTAHKGNLGGTT